MQARPVRLLFACCLIVTSASAADFAAAVKAYDQGDYATAAKEWRPIADGGEPAAQFNLGMLYYDGRGVPQDFEEAVKWLRRSADQGYAKAQHNLGALYGVGKGVRRDYVQAYKWLSLCAAADEKGCEEQRDLVAKKLKPSKLTEAQRLTREWKPERESQQ